MKNLLNLASMVLLILAVLIIYLGMQRESVFNPPNITGVGFIVIAMALLYLGKKLQ